jgi:type II restriction enzyme
MSNSPPSFCFLRYNSATWEVTDLFVIPSFFFTLEAIEKRQPLSATARRAGWIGCNILLNRIPAAGKLFYVHDRAVTPMSKIRSSWSRMLSLKNETAPNKGWLLQVLKCVEELPRREFSLIDIYAYEPRLRAIYPGNNNIQPKIRQQLQQLREKGYIRFLGNGNYLRCDQMND